MMKAPLSRRQLLVATGAAGLTASFQAAASNPRPVVGLSLPGTGVQATVARELFAGYEAALKATAELIVVDDESKADKTAEAYESFGRDSRIVAATGIVGTPHAKKALPAAVEAGLPVVGIRSGADDLRDGNPWVWHLRASYGDELRKVIEVASVYTSIGILYSDDDFGRGALVQARKFAEVNKLKIAAALPCDRNGADVKQQASQLIKLPGVSCVLLCLIQRPAMEAAMAMRDARYMMPIYGMSFIATAQLARSESPLLDGIALVSPFPLARVATMALARSFRQAMIDAKTPELIVSPTTFEGYFYGSVLNEALAKGGARRRKDLQSYLAINRPLEVKEVQVRFDELRVGYRYLALLRKEGQTLRT